MAKRMELNAIPLSCIPEMFSGQLHIFLHYVGYYINLPKPTSKTTWVESFSPSSWKGYCSCPKSFNYLVIPQNAIHIDASKQR
jgi:hypothetical protein